MTPERVHIPVEPIDFGSLPKTYLHPGELETLIHLVQSVSAQDMLEIGCNNGRTARAILDNVPSLKTYTGIDVFKGYQFPKRVQRNEVPEIPGEYAIGDPRFRLVCTARGSYDFEHYRIPGQGFDVVFIDGDHSQNAVEHDTQLALKNLRHGGIIIWHDYHEINTVDVKPVIDSLVQKGMQIKHVVGTWLCYFRSTD